MNNESFCLPGDWNCGCMDNMSDSEANFLFFGNDDGFVSTAKRPNGSNVKVLVHFKGGVPVIRLQWKGGWSEYRPAIDGNGLIKITYDRYFDEKKESRSNIKDALFHVPNSNDLWNRVKTAMDEYVLYKNNVKINENRKMNKKQTIKLDESKLKEIVKESVKNVINENKLHDVEMFIRDGETMDEMYMISRQIANVFGDDSLAREICSKMYWAVIDFLKGRI